MQLFRSQVDSIPCLDSLLGINRKTGWNLGIVNFKLWVLRYDVSLPVLTVRSGPTATDLKPSGLDHSQCLVFDDN